MPTIIKVCPPSTKHPAPSTSFPHHDAIWRLNLARDIALESARDYRAREEPYEADASAALAERLKTSILVLVKDGKKGTTKHAKGAKGRGE